MQQEHAYELAMWRAKEAPAGNRELIVSLTNGGLAKLKGMINRTVYQSVDDPRLLFDWVEWDTMEHAVQAAQNMMSVPELQSFVQLIEQTELFEHYQPAESHVITDRQDGIVELVAYTLREDGDIGTFFSTYTDVVAEQEGYFRRYLLKDAKTPNSWLEFVYWESAEKAQAAAAAMRQNPGIGKAMEMVADIKMLHRYFQVFG